MADKPVSDPMRGSIRLSARKWPPDAMEAELAQVGRVIVSFNALEAHTRGVLRQFIIDDFKDRTVLGLCQSLNGVELEKNLRRFARSLDVEKGDIGCEEAIKHLIKVYQSGKSLRNRLVHELSNSLINGKMHLHKHVFSPDHSSKGLALDHEILARVVEWLSDASNFSARVGIHLSYIRGLRSERERQYDPGDTGQWPEDLPLLSWDDLERTRNQR